MSVLCHRSSPTHIDEKNPGFIASGDDRGYIRTWLLEKPWTPLLNIEAHTGAVLSMTLKRPMENSQIDRYRLLTTGEDRKFRVFDALTGECLGCVSNHTGPIQSLSVLSLNGPLLEPTVNCTTTRWAEDIVLTAGLDKRINFWRLSDMALVHSMNREKPVRGISATTVPRPMMIATSMDEGLEVIDLTLYDHLPDDFKHLVLSHEPESKRNVDDEDM